MISYLTTLIHHDGGIFWGVFLLSSTLFSQTSLPPVHLDTMTIAQGLQAPWDMAYAPGEDLLFFTELDGRIGQVTLKDQKVITLYTITDLARELQAGVQGLALHPDFPNTPSLYVAYNYYQGDSIYLKVSEFHYQQQQLTLHRHIIEQIPALAINIGGRIEISPDRYLYLSVGEGEYSESAQEWNNYYGKILRYHLDGRIPEDNPKKNNPIWANGLRNAQGLTFSGNQLYCSEHGTLGDDELNLVVKKGNYGWPHTGGKCIDNRKVCDKLDLIDPLLDWSPSIAPSGIAAYRGDRISTWKNSILMACLKTQALKVVKLSNNGDRIVAEADYLKRVLGRIRDVEVTPDGRVFVCTSNRDVYGNPRPGGDRIVELIAVDQPVIAEVNIPQKEGVQRIHLDSTVLDVYIIRDSLVLPWDMVWGPDQRIWFSERGGSIKRMHPETGEIDLIHHIDTVFESVDNSGMHGFALHPDFPETPHLYVHYTVEAHRSQLIRMTFDPSQQKVVQSEILLDDLEAHKSHNGSRIVFGPDGMLYFSIGDAYRKKLPQSLKSNNGKILRMTPDGKIPEDNPFPNSYVWSYGHRNPQGLVWTPDGHLFSTEHGAVNDDEFNLIEKGRNYGWPKVQGYCDKRSEKKICAEKKIMEPLHSWTPTIGVCGIDYFNHPSIPEWRNSILTTSLKGGAGDLGQRLTVFNLTEKGDQVQKVQDYFTFTFGRLRDVLVAPDGRIFLCTSNVETNGNGWESIRENDDLIVVIKAIPPTTNQQPVSSQNKVQGKTE